MFGFFSRTNKLRLQVYRIRSTDFTRSSSFLMALLAKTSNGIETIGRNIPIPFSETMSVASPDTLSVRYTNNPNSITFNIIFSLFKTNCLLRFLKLKILITVSIVPAKNKIIVLGINMKYTFSFNPLYHKGKTKGNTPKAIKARNIYTV